jgi:hypothetical protein
VLAKRKSPLLSGFSSAIDIDGFTIGGAVPLTDFISICKAEQIRVGTISGYRKIY